MASNSEKKTVIFVTENNDDPNTSVSQIKPNDLSTCVYLIKLNEVEVDDFDPFKQSVDEKEIIEKIYTTHHGDANETFKWYPLFAVVQGVLERSSEIVEDEIGYQDKKPKNGKIRTPISTDFNVPVLVLKQIIAEMTSFNRNQKGQKISHRTTVRILKKLETYSWDAKAVLTLAAFAMEFRDFSCPLSSQFHQLAAADQEFAESLSISTKVLFFNDSFSEAQKCGQRTVDELREIKNCIMTALQVLEAIFKLHKLTSAYNKEGLSELKEPLMVYIYWIIMAVVTCATRITVLTWDESDKPKDNLEHYPEKFQIILDKLNTRLKSFTEDNIDETEHYWATVQISINPTDVTNLLETMFQSPVLFDYTERKWVKADSLRGKKTLFFITNDLSLSGDDTSLLTALRNKINEVDKFQLVWIPVVERRCKNSELSEKTTWWPGTKSASYYLPATPTNRTEHLYWELEDNSTVPVEEPSPIETQPEPEAEAETQTKTVVKYVKKGVLYGYHHPPTIKIPAIAYIKEEWHFKGKTILVVINEQGIVENYNAVDILRSWGTEAFPFDKEAVRRLILEKINWPGTVVRDLGVARLKHLIKNEKRYIFFYGGRDKEWTQKFEKTIESVEQRLSSDQITKISWYCIGKNDRYGKEWKENNVNSQFWNGVEKLFLSTEGNRNLESVTREIQTLLSYKYQDGWVMICQGPRPVMSGHGETVLLALEKLDRKLEKGSVKIDYQKSTSFEEIFKDCHNNVIKKYGGRCCQLSIPYASGKRPEERKCSECDNAMEVKLLYECCHRDTYKAARR